MTECEEVAIPFPEFEDGEVLGIDNDGCVIQWNADDREAYNCGETLEQFGIHNLHPHEIRRIGG